VSETLKQLIHLNLAQAEKLLKVTINIYVHSHKIYNLFVLALETGRKAIFSSLFLNPQSYGLMAQLVSLVL